MASRAFPKLKVVYFEFGGRVEATRLALFLADIPFEDVFVEHCEGFAATPAAQQYPYQMLPVMEVDGVMIAESIAMLRYVGRLANMYPVNDPIGALLVDEVLELVEVFTEINLHWEREPNPVYQQALEKDLLNVVIPHYFYEIDAKLAALESHPTLAHTSQITILDLVLRSFVEYIIRPDWPKFVPDRTKISNWLKRIDKVNNHPKVQVYYALQKLRTDADKTPYKLTDVDSPNARSTPIRAAFKLAGIPFVDDRVDPQEAAKVKASLPFPSQFPVLTGPDGRVISRTNSILRFVGSLSNLYPTDQDPILSFRIDELLAQLEDLQNLWYYPSDKTDDDQRQREHREFLETKLIPRSLTNLNNRVGSWAAPHATGSTFTIADLAIQAVLGQLSSGEFLPGPPFDVTPYNNLTKIQQTVQDRLQSLK